MRPLIRENDQARTQRDDYERRARAAEAERDRLTEDTRAARLRAAMLSESLLAVATKKDPRTGDVCWCREEDHPVGMLHEPACMSARRLMDMEG